MIKELKLRFEAHAGSVVKLAKGLTVLLGSNDHGKSAVNRAANWAVNNTPRGDSMIPWTGKKNAEVELVTDKHTVVRKKGATGSGSYEVDGDVYAALGSAVPEEVTTALRMGYLNVQKQVDQYFLLQATPGDVAKKINAIAGIEDSDAAIKQASSRISDTNKEITRLETEIKTAKEYINEHAAGVTAAEEAYDKLFKTETTVVEDSAAVAAAEILADDISDSKQKLSKFPDTARVEAMLEDLAVVVAEVDKQADFVRDAAALCVQLRSVDLGRFKGLEEIDLGYLATLEEKSRRLVERLTGMVTLRDQLRGVDLEKFNAVEEIGRRLDDMEDRAKKIAGWETQIAQATALAEELGKWIQDRPSVPDIEILNSLEMLAEKISQLEHKTTMLVEMMAMAKNIEELGTEIEEYEKNLMALSEYCSECGRKLDEIHTHSR